MYVLMPLDSTTSEDQPADTIVEIESDKEEEEVVVEDPVDPMVVLDALFNSSTEVGP
jgi:hypothetical protein